MSIDRTQFKRFLIDSGLVSRKDVERADIEASARTVRMGDVLREQGKISESALRRVLARAEGIPFVDLNGRKIAFEALCVIPEPISRRHDIVCIAKDGRDIEVAFLDAKSMDEVGFLSEHMGFKVAPRYTDAASLRSALLAYQKGLKTEYGDAIGRETEPSRIVDLMLRHALVQHASDIHIEPAEDALSVRYRIGGRMHDAMVLPLALAESIASRLKSLSGLSPARGECALEGAFAVDMNGEKTHAKATFVPTVLGEKAVLRLSGTGSGTPSLDQIGLHGEALERVHEALRRRSGMILAATPARSDRAASSFLYASIDAMNSPAISIATVESSVIRRIPRASQTEIRPDIGFGFAEGVRAILRQDPDVIMIGEIGDRETAALAASAARRGKLVIAAIRADSAAEALSKLGSFGLDPLAIASIVSIVVAERPLRKLAPKRSSDPSRRPLSKAELSVLGKAIDLDKMLGILRVERAIGPKDGWNKVEFESRNPGKGKAVGSDDAIFQGHIDIHEALAMTPSLKELVMKGSPTLAIERQAAKEGMLSLIEDGIFAAARGLTTIEEVLRSVSE